MANSITAITAGGLDSITVGISLNGNGVVHNVFCIPGDVAGWNNGSFYPVFCQLGPQFLPPPEPPLPGINIIGTGGLILGGTTPQLLLKDASGIYTLTPNKHDDTLIDRQPGQDEIDVKIPDPLFKTGYIGG